MKIFLAKNFFDEKFLVEIFGKLFGQKFFFGQGLNVSKSQRVRVSMSQGQSLKVLKIQGLKVTRSQGLMVYFHL